MVVLPWSTWAIIAMLRKFMGRRNFLYLSGVGRAIAWLIGKGNSAIGLKMGARRALRLFRHEDVKSGQKLLADFVLFQKNLVHGLADRDD
jgi:hypothetical protein